ncbi:MAG: TonB family protein [Pyrinomonadaceae bacterium]
MRSFFTIILLVLSFVGSNFAQENQPKVVKYIAPKYPLAAKAVHATGKVVVAVKINKDGGVISSKTESGHPLLRLSSEEAARQWIFSSNDEVTEREVKIIFVYKINLKAYKKDKIEFKKPYRLEYSLQKAPEIDY